MIHIRTLGALEIQDSSGTADVDAVLAQPKRLALLLYLTVHRGGLRTRDELQAVFWPESPAHRAANALNQSLHFLRVHLGRASILTRGEGVEVDRTRILCDAVRFEELLDEGRRADALELYGGELLFGFHLSGVRQFESWLEGERRRLADRAVEAALELGRSADAEGNPASAARWYREALRWQPYREAVLRELIRALLDAGERPAALREAGRFARRLEDDLGMAPSQGLRSLLDTIRNGPVPSVSGEGEAPAPTPAPEPEQDGTASPEPPSGARLDPTGGAEGRLRRIRAGIRRPVTLAALALGVAVAAAMGAMLLTEEEAGGRGLDGGRILIGSLQPLDGDPERARLGRLAAEWAAREIGSTGLVEVVSPQAVAGWSGREGETDGSADRGLLDAARRTGAGYLLDGFVSVEDGAPRLGARIVRVSSGAIVRTVPAVAIPSGSPMAGIREFGRRAVGAVAAVTDARVGSWAAAAAPPPSFSAYRHFVEGLEAFAARDNSAALRSFRAAAAEDTLFALPLLWQMTVQLLVLDDVMKADSLVRLVEPHREALTVWEAAMLDYHSASVRGDRRGAYRAMSTVVSITPEPQWIGLLASEALRLNRIAAALHHLARIPRPTEDPSAGWPLLSADRMRAMTAEALHRAGRHREELRLARGAGSETTGVLPRAELRALAGLGRWEDALRRVRALSPSLDNTAETRWTLRELATELRAHGAPEGAVAEVLDVALSYHRSDTKSDPIGHGRTLVLAGRYQDAERIFDEVRAAGVFADVVRGDLALLAALHGDTAAALAADEAYAEGANPYDLGWNTQWRARIAAALGDRSRAVALLRDAYSQGWSHLIEDHRSPDWEPLRGYPPFDRLTAPDPAPLATRLSLESH